MSVVNFFILYVSLCVHYLEFFFAIMCDAHITNQQNHTNSTIYSDAIVLYVKKN